MSNRIVFEQSFDIPSNTPHGTNFDGTFESSAQNGGSHDVIVDNSEGTVGLNLNINVAEVFNGITRVVESNAPTIDDGACNSVTSLGILRDEVKILLQTASDVVDGFTVRVRIRSK